MTGFPAISILDVLRIIDCDSLETIVQHVKDGDPRNLAAVRLSCKALRDTVDWCAKDISVSLDAVTDELVASGPFPLSRWPRCHKLSVSRRRWEQNDPPAPVPELLVPVLAAVPLAARRRITCIVLGLRRGPGQVKRLGAGAASLLQHFPSLQSFASLYTRGWDDSVMKALSSLPDLEEVHLQPSGAIHDLHLLAGSLRRLKLGPAGSRSALSGNLPSVTLQGISQLSRLEELRLKYVHSMDDLCSLLRAAPPSLRSLKLGGSQALAIDGCRSDVTFELKGGCPVSLTATALSLRKLACFPYARSLQRITVMEQYLDACGAAEASLLRDLAPPGVSFRADRGLTARGADPEALVTWLRQLAERAGLTGGGASLFCRRLPGGSGSLLLRCGSVPAAAAVAAATMQLAAGASSETVPDEGGLAQLQAFLVRELPDGADPYAMALQLVFLEAFVQHVEDGDPRNLAAVRLSCKALRDTIDWSLKRISVSLDMITDELVASGPFPLSRWPRCSELSVRRRRQLGNEAPAHAPEVVASVLADVPLATRRRITSLSLELGLCLSDTNGLGAGVSSLLRQLPSIRSFSQSAASFGWDHSVMEALSSLPDLEEVQLQPFGAIDGLNLLAGSLRRLTLGSIGIRSGSVRAAAREAISQLSRLEELRLTGVYSMEDLCSWLRAAPPSLRSLMLVGSHVMAPKGHFSNVSFELEGGRPRLTAGGADPEALGAWLRQLAERAGLTGGGASLRCRRLPGGCGALLLRCGSEPAAAAVAAAAMQLAAGASSETAPDDSGLAELQAVVVGEDRDGEDPFFVALHVVSG
ncbi:hypothetical protein GPECTOR_564g590 [Gonium pectorale]|uniref:Uncharacterized protein n=1 Tax=Gonium pectorale TaxID=33097 RepID=A0A150FUM2_GONPE|nr:hypothetical protein GPECTOR_564g590 [Gonium pectorale]|eukprot:KXZ41307.1 hypothetical protein GPECTOR_564g590 [Gonium pectorale]